MILHFGIVEGLPEEENRLLNDLEVIYKHHNSANRLKRRFYEGKITLNEVNLGIALPSSIGRLQIGCAWGAKAVDVLAARSMFDGYVSSSGASADLMQSIIRRNHLISEYKKACRSELAYGSVYAAVFGGKGNAKVRFYDPHCAAAKWDAEEGRIECGFAFEDGRLHEEDHNWSPDNVVFYTATDIWDLNRISGIWYAERTPHKFGRPMMVALTWNATADKPFGQSRLKYPVRNLIRGYIRTVANASIGLEFSTTPQKYLLGITPEMYDVLEKNKFSSYVGSLFMSTQNPETGSNPVFGQLQQGDLKPHIDMLRTLATQFSAATGLTVTDTGVINDANPTSSDAILAQSQTLVRLAEELNEGNGDALYTIGQLAMAIETGTTPDSLPDDAKDVIAHFKNPAMPSIAASADAAIKIASSREGFAETDVFLEMVGFDQADVRRIKSQEAIARGKKALKEILEEGSGDGNIN